MIAIRSKRELELIKDACRISAEALQTGGLYCRAGVTTYEVDKAIERYILSCKARPNFKNYNGFPASACISVNDTVIHGIPSKETVLKEGDIVSIDTGACYKGYNGDNAYTFEVGTVSDEAKELINTTQMALLKAIEEAKEGNRVGDISSCVEKEADSMGYGIVKDYVGHGVGESLHEEPEIPNFGKPGHGARLKEGMVLAIEPMINQEGEEVMVLDDGWTVKTKSGKLSAHFEHTVVVGKDKGLIFTKV